MLNNFKVEEVSYRYYTIEVDGKLLKNSDTSYMFIKEEVKEYLEDNFFEGEEDDN